MNSDNIVLRCKIDRHAMLRTVTKQFTLHNVLIDILSMTCTLLSWAAWEESHWGLRRGRLKLAVCGELIDGEDPALPLPLCCWGNWWEGAPEGQNPLLVDVNDDWMLPTACGWGGSGKVGVWSLPPIKGGGILRGKNCEFERKTTPGAGVSLGR